MIELIQQHDEEPSIFQDGIRASGYGFHHVAITTEEFDEQAARLASLAGPATLEDTLPTGARVAFFDGAVGYPGMVELVELTPAQARTYDDLRAACTDWDGADPWRRS